MLTGKQRAYLRSLAQKLDPIFQVGKKGIEDTFIVQVDQALEKRELIKIKVLENSGMGTREAQDIICQRVGAEGIQVIGSKMVIYRAAKKDPKIELPKGK